MARCGKVSLCGASPRRDEYAEVSFLGCFQIRRARIGARISIKSTTFGPPPPNVLGFPPIDFWPLFNRPAGREKRRKWAKSVASRPTGSISGQSTTGSGAGPDPGRGFPKNRPNLCPNQHSRGPLLANRLLVTFQSTSPPTRQSTGRLGPPSRPAQARCAAPDLAT